MQATQSLIWAVDLFGEDAKLQKKSAAFLNHLSRTLKTKVIPTYVLSPIPFLFRAIPEPTDGLKYRAETTDLRERLESWAKSFGVESIDKCEVLLSDDASVRSEVEVLIKFAEAENAQMIVLSTQARKGMGRFFLGSFAETLVLRSPVPLMLVQPTTKLAPQIKDILFPTDFSEKSKRSLVQVEVLALAMGARIQLFHHLEYMTPSFTDMSLPKSRVEKLLKEMWGGTKREKASAGKAWADELKQHGIACKFTLSDNPLFAVDDILAFSLKLKSGMIAISSQSNPGFAELIGGIARRVVRQAQIPVWVVHPAEMAKAQVTALI